MKITSQSFIVAIGRDIITGGYFESWGDDDSLTLRLPQSIGGASWERFISRTSEVATLSEKLYLLNPFTLGLKEITIENASKLAGLVIL